MTTSSLAKALMTRMRELAAAVGSAPAATLAETRARIDAAGAATPPPQGTRVESVDAGGVHAVWVAAPGATRERCVLLLHGGAYALGSIASHTTMAGELSQACGAVVLLPAYRLAPEDPFPAGLHDTLTVYRFLLAHIGAPQLAVAGDSAGGGLALAAMVAARDEHLSMPASLVLISPWADLTCEGPGYGRDPVIDPVIGDGAALRVRAAEYLAAASPRDPLASPARADLTGLPPTLVLAAEGEVLAQDAVAVGERARACGVEATVELWPEMIHDWTFFAPRLPESARAFAQIGEFVRKRWDA